MDERPRSLYDHRSESTLARRRATHEPGRGAFRRAAVGPPANGGSDQQRIPLCSLQRRKHGCVPLLRCQGEIHGQVRLVRGQGEEPVRHEGVRHRRQGTPSVPQFGVREGEHALGGRQQGTLPPLCGARDDRLPDLQRLRGSLLSLRREADSAAAVPRSPSVRPASVPPLSGERRIEDVRLVQRIARIPVPALPVDGHRVARVPAVSGNRPGLLSPLCRAREDRLQELLWNRVDSTEDVGKRQARRSSGKGAPRRVPGEGLAAVPRLQGTPRCVLDGKPVESLHAQGRKGRRRLHPVRRKKASRLHGMRPRRVPRSRDLGRHPAHDESPRAGGGALGGRAEEGRRVLRPRRRRREKLRVRGRET